MSVAFTTSVVTLRVSDAADGKEYFAQGWPVRRRYLPEIYIRPVLVGRRVRINAVIMFIGIVGGILTMGLAGFVLGPVIIVLLITSFRMYSSDRKERKEAAAASCDQT